MSAVKRHLHLKDDCWLGVKTHYCCTLRCTPIQLTKSSPPPFWFPTLLDHYVLLSSNLYKPHHFTNLVSYQLQYVKPTYLLRNIHAYQIRRVFISIVVTPHQLGLSQNHPLAEGDNLGSLQELYAVKC